MSKPKPCPNNCGNLVKNSKAKQCIVCYNRNRPIPKNAFKRGETAGANHPSWKGGRWLYWRKQTLTRDDYTCQICGLRDPDIMDVDHIVPIKMTLRERRDAEKERRLKIEGIDGLQTLCPNCHKRKSVAEARERRKDTVHLKHP